MLKIYRWLGIVLVLMTLRGCSQYVDGTKIPAFSLLEIGDEIPYDNYYRPQGTALMIVSSAQGRTDLLTSIPPEAKQSINSVNLDTSLLLAVFDGERFTNGYRVSIINIIKQPNHLYIYTQFIKPKPKQLLQQGGPRSALSIVSVERSAFAANERLTVHLMDDDTKQEVLVQEYTIQ